MEIRKPPMKNPNFWCCNKYKTHKNHVCIDLIWQPMLYANYKEINENNGHILLECNSVSVTRKANMMINLNTNSEISLAQI